MGADLSYFHGNRLRKDFPAPNASPNSLRQFLFLNVGNLAFQDTWPPKRPRCRRPPGVSASPNTCQDALRQQPGRAVACLQPPPSGAWGPTSVFNSGWKEMNDMGLLKRESSSLAAPSTRGNCPGRHHPRPLPISASVRGSLALPFCRSVVITPRRKSLGAQSHAFSARGLGYLVVTGLR